MRGIEPVLIRNRQARIHKRKLFRCHIVRGHVKIAVTGRQRNSILGPCGPMGNASEKQEYQDCGTTHGFEQLLG